MADDNKEDRSGFVAAESTDFANHQTDAVNGADQTANEKEEAGTDDEEKSDLRINQIEYTQLLKDLDFSHAKVVDVTGLLSDEGGNYLTPDENENQKKLSSDEKYISLSSVCSSESSNEAIHHHSAKDDESTASQISTGKYDNEENIVLDTPRKEDEQATQHYEQEDITSSSKSNKASRFPTQHSTSIQDDNLSSIPRLNTNANNYVDIEDQSHEHIISWENLINGTDAFGQTPTIVIISQPSSEAHLTPTKQQQSVSSPEPQPKISPPKQKTHYRSRQLSASSDTDSAVEHGTHRLKRKQHSTSQQQLSVDENHDELKQTSFDQYRPYTTASDILLRRLSNQPNDQTSSNRKRSSPKRHGDAPTTDNWLSVFEKLEHEHKERLDKQQKQYEDYMHHLEGKMKQRFDEYLSTTNSLQESKAVTPDQSIHLQHSHTSAPIDSNGEKYKTYSHSHQYRPLAKELVNPTYSTESTNYDKRQLNGTNLSRSQSREDISNLKTELSAKHTKHISDLKLYYEHEINDLIKQLNISKMGNTSTTTRQSIETIERINNDNIRLHDEIKELRRSLKTTEQENISLKRQLDELREQLNNKDLELKDSHRATAELEQQLNQTQHIKVKQDDRFRQADRQALLYREENEKITNELNLTRERLLRLEERYRELENEKKPIRNEIINQRVNDDLKFPTTMSLNMPTSREYGRFTLSTSRYSSSTISTPRDGNIHPGRFTSNDSDDLFHHGNSSRPLTTLYDYINEKPNFVQTYAPPSRPVYSPRKLTPTRQHVDQMPVRDLVEDQIKQSEQLEEKFDDLLKKKRDLESRINRIPTRGLTNNDRQLLDVLEREIERVDQQISSVKLELRKMNIIRTH